MNEGYIKFKLDHEIGPAPKHPDLEELNKIRTELHELHLIGMFEHGEYKGVGFGNASVRVAGTEQFVTTGTATGKSVVLDLNQYVLVTEYDISHNHVVCKGKVKASSESMSHGAIYLSNPEVGCVLHIHDKTIWQFMLDKGYLKTPKSAEYGTPEMAEAIMGVVKSIKDPFGIFVMEGHEEGVMAYGNTLAKARELILDIQRVVANLK